MLAGGTAIGCVSPCAVKDGSPTLIAGAVAPTLKKYKSISLFLLKIKGLKLDESVGKLRQAIFFSVLCDTTKNFLFFSI